MGAGKKITVHCWCTQLDIPF